MRWYWLRTSFLLSAMLGCDGGLPEGTAVTGEARSADGVTISYEVRGAGDPALVLVHGWANTRAIWGVHPQALSREHQVVTLDLAGHGASGASRQQWTMDAFGEDVVAVLEELELDGVVLVGFSMGAIAALEAAERLGDRVLGVVFVDAIHDPDLVINVAQAEQFMGTVRERWGDTAFIRAFGFMPDAPDSLLTYVVEEALEPPHEYLFAAFEAQVDWMASELIPTLQRIDPPIAAINTAAVPTNVEAMQRYAPSFTVDTLEGVGHGGILLRRVEEFDERLLAIVDRFASE